ncbi:hypothetical protein [Paenibacillus chitinolyticus]
MKSFVKSTSFGPKFWMIFIELGPEKFKQAWKKPLKEHSNVPLKQRLHMMRTLFGSYEILHYKEFFTKKSGNFSPSLMVRFSALSVTASF